MLGSIAIVTSIKLSTPWICEDEEPSLVAAIVYMSYAVAVTEVSAGVLGSYEGYDEVVAFNNNILATVTDHYLHPAKALDKKQEKRFQEDYKKWFLEKEVGNKFPLGEPRPKNVEQPQEEVVEEQVDEFAEFAEN